MLGGPYELVVAGGADGVVELPSAWHILTASILQLPAGAGDRCMLVRSIPGDCGFLLEHDVVQIAVATIKASAPVPASRKMRRSVMSGFAPGFQAAGEAAAAPLRARSSSPTLRQRMISSLRTM